MIPALQQVHRRIATILPTQQLRAFATMSSSQYSLTSTVKLNNGLQMPRFGLGTWRSEKGKVKTVVKEAVLNQGYIHLDCAYAYGNHNEVGEGLKEAIQESKGKIKREDIWVTSKLWCNAHEPSRAKAQVDEILKDLQLEYLDLLLIHWPSSWKPEKDTIMPSNPNFDDSHTIKDTWQALESLVDSGKLKAIGISNYTEEETEEILQFAKIKPAVNQSESHPYFNNHKLAQWNIKKNIQFTAYSPLGNVSADKVDESPLKHPVITKIAEAHKKSPAQVIIRWHLQNNHIVIPKTVNPERVKENAQVFDFELSQEEVQKINGMDKGAEGRLVNPKFRKNGQTNFPGPSSVAQN